MFRQVKEIVVSNAVLATTQLLMLRGNRTDSKESQFANALAPIVVSELGRTIDFKALQLLKASAGIAIVPAGIVASPFAFKGYIQRHIALVPVYVTPEGLFTQLKAFVVSNAVLATVTVIARGNTTAVKEAQLKNALPPILVTVAGIEILVRPLEANAFM